MTRNSKKKKSAKLPAAEYKVTDHFLDEIADQEYKTYGIATIEDRAIFGNIDGLKPVSRRLLWAAHEAGWNSKSPRVKSAQIVGQAMGRYHPHGDSSIYGALVTSMHLPVKLIDGDGNIGTMTDPPAAMRYTNARTSKFADRVFFDKFYLPACDFVDNYDGSYKEPLILPTLLPNALMNGNFGIAPGVRTATPTITWKTLAPVLIRAIKENGCTAEMCSDLDFTTPYDGKLKRSKTTKREMREFAKTGQGKFVFESSYKEVKGNLRFDKFAPFSKNVESVLARVEKLNGVTGTRNDSDKADKFEVAFLVFLSKSLKGESRQKVIDNVMEAFSANISYSIQVSKRFLDPMRPDGGKELSPSTIPKLVDAWIAYRVKLEKRACKYWSKKREKEIDYLKLMIRAVDARAFIIKALDKKFNDDQLAAYIAKGLRVTVDQANQILDLKIRALKRLEKDTLNNKIKELKTEIAGYDDRIARPKRFIASQIKDFHGNLMGK